MSDDTLTAAFSALADPTRRAILARLSEGPATVAEIAEPFPLSGPAISKHLRVLEQAGIVSAGRDGQRRPRSLVPGALAPVEDWLSDFHRAWEARHDRLALLLADIQENTAIQENTHPKENRA